MAAGQELARTQSRGCTLVEVVGWRCGEERTGIYWGVTTDKNLDSCFLMTLMLQMHP